MRKKNLLITGGNGFIGQNFLKKIDLKKYNVINIDCLSSSSDRSVKQRFRKIKFLNFNICNNIKLKDVFLNFKPDIVVNFAAHSHVDTSISNSRIFLENINGTYNLLENSLNIFKKKKIKYLQISTDEVFGEIEKGAFDSESPYKPNSPYSASKASSDHLVRVYNRTYDLPTSTTYSCNNYGPFQHLEKLIPLTIYSFLSKKKMGIYGKGLQKRQWIHVEDNIEVLHKVMKSKFSGLTYCIGSKYESKNLDLVKKIIKILHCKFNNDKSFDFYNYVKFVNDRPGHDQRYFLDYKKISKEFNWKQKIDLNFGLDYTINWYINNSMWIKSQKQKLKKYF